MGNITGTFRSVDRAALTELRRAAQSGNQIDATEIDAIEQAAQNDGNLSSGEQALIQQLRAATAGGSTVQNLQLAGFDPATPEVSFDVNFGPSNQGQVSAETPTNFVQNLTRLEPGARTRFLSMMNSSGLSGLEQKQLAQVLNRAGTPEQAASLIQALSSTRSDGVRSFNSQFMALSAQEQQATAEISHLLQQNPAPANLAADLRTRMAALPADQPPLPTAGRHGMAVGRALNALGLNLPPTNPAAPGVEDASGRLSNVVMGPYSHNVQQDYIRDMLTVARRENFQVTLQTGPMTPAEVDTLKQQILTDMPGVFADVTELNRYLQVAPATRAGYEWAEDNKWIAADGTVVTTPDADTAVNNMIDFVNFDAGVTPGAPGSQGHHTAGLPTSDTHDVVAEGAAQAAVTDRNQHLAAQDLAAAMGRPVRQSRTYNEGGNMLVGTFPNGDPYAVIGQDGVIASAFQLEEQYAANPATVPEFAPANVTARRTAMGLDGAFNTLPADTQRLIDDTATRLNRGPVPAAGQAAARDRAIEFLVHQDIAKDVFAQDVGVPRENLVFVAQPDFHIDMHMRPLGPGEMMSNDFSANRDLLLDALSRAAPGSSEAAELQTMLDHNTQVAAAMQPVMDQIASQLRERGISVVRAPGVLEGQTSNGLTRRANFMNAIPSTRPGSNQQFYITNYTSLPSLRSAYEAYMRRERGVEDIYWIGDDGGSATSLSISEVSLNRDGGLDCRENH